MFLDVLPDLGGERVRANVDRRIGHIADPHRGTAVRGMEAHRRGSHALQQGKQVGELVGRVEAVNLIVAVEQDANKIADQL